MNKTEATLVGKVTELTRVSQKCQKIFPKHLQNIAPNITRNITPKNSPKNQ